jgi:putative MATE family efflux protein
VHSTDRIGTEKISRLLWSFSIPAIIGMLVNAIYNIVDRIYVGQGVNPLGIAGITLVMPVMMVIQAASMLVGIGANSLFAIRLGEGRSGEVEKIMGHAFVLLFLIPFIVIVIIFIFMDSILINILGAGESVFPFAKSYLRIILYGSVFAAMGPGINHFIRSDGHPRTSMTTQIIGAGLNIILDPIFIFVFGWGIAGAAWATIFSQFVSFVWVMYYFNSKYTKLRFRPRAMRLEFKVTSEILAIGFAPFAMQLAMSLVNILMNNALVQYGGDNAVTAMGIAFSILIICFMPLQGLTQGAQPIIGYNYGARHYRRVIDTVKLALVSATIFLAAGWIVIQLFPAFFVSIFTKEQGELKTVGIRCLHIATLMFPVIGIQMIGANYFQAVGKPLQSTILSMSRQLLFYIPILSVLPRFFARYGLSPLDGVFAAMPCADILAVSCTTVFLLAEWKKLKSLANNEG